MTVKNGAIALVLMLLPLGATALEINGNKILNGTTYAYGTPEWRAQMQADGLVALYLFDSNDPTTVFDRSQYVNSTTGNPELLNLTIDDPDADRPSNNIEVSRGAGYVKFELASLIHSNGPATKINRDCKANNAYTVEAWLRNDTDGKLGNIFPARRIVTLEAEVDQDSSGSIDQANELSSQNPNFFLAQQYIDSNRYVNSVRTNQGAGEDRFSQESDQNVAKQNELQHVIFSRGSDGVGRLFVSFLDEDGNIRDSRKALYSNIDSLEGDLANWHDNAVLGLGNGISYANPLSPDREDEDGNTLNTTNTREQNTWNGELHLVAVYCKGLTDSDVLGDRGAGKPLYQSFSIDPAMNVSPEMEKAALLYKRLAGVSTSLANPIISDMATDIANGNLIGAAARATETREFLNITVRDFAARMSTREETVNAPLNDFIATVIGVTRDNTNAKQLLSGDFLYEGDLSKAAVSKNRIQDMALSNRHFEELAAGRFDIGDVLIKKSPQVLFNGNMNAEPATALVPNNDAAGILTSRAFMEAHATAGTNRRLVEYTFREFLCVPMEKWADSEGPDNYVGRDIDRFPAGDHNKYTTSCRSCHSVMDSLRGAFAFYTFKNGFVKNTLVMNRQPADDIDDDTPGTVVQVYTGTNVVTKMNHNEHTSPEGHMITTDTFLNQATNTSNSSYFGWDPAKLSGKGVKEFGEMVANSEAFPFCMAKRVYRSVCKREPASIDKQLLEKAANDFKSANFSFKKLFQTIAISEECLGEDL